MKGSCADGPPRGRWGMTRGGSTRWRSVFSRMDAAGAFKVGGEGVIVEVDECWVMKEKDGTDVWVVGVIEREVTIDGRGVTARKVCSTS